MWNEITGLHLQKVFAVEEELAGIDKYDIRHF